MATRNCLFVKNVAIQDQIPDMDINGSGRAVVCGLQNHTGSEHPLAAATGNLRNQRYPPIDLNAIGRIHRG